MLRGVTLLLVLGACSAEPLRAAEYGLHFTANFSENDAYARARIDVDQNRANLRALDFNVPRDRYELIEADGTTESRDGRLLWSPPRRGGGIAFKVKVDSAKGDAYDARHTGDWILMRLDDLFPPATIRVKKGADPIATVSMDGPKGWSFESPYGDLTRKVKPVEGTRNFLRPTGWLVGGRIGTRRDTIAGRKVTVAAPQNSGFRRLDTLAFLNWTLPELARAFPTLPKQLLLVGAPQEMWRGGLSAPSSLYLHVTRPLISENGTSPVLHELAHAGGLHSAARGSDWIVEGLAEYYGLVVLRRTGGLSALRFERAIGDQREWAASADGRLSDPSTGADTARAVVVFHELAAELREKGHNIDQVLAGLLAEPPISATVLRTVTTDLLGAPSAVLRKALKEAE